MKNKKQKLNRNIKQILKYHYKYINCNLNILKHKIN